MDLESNPYSPNNVSDINIALYFYNSSTLGNTQVHAPLFFLGGWQPLLPFSNATWDNVHFQYAYTTLIDSIFKRIDDYDKYTSLSNGICMQFHGEPPWRCKYIDHTFYNKLHDLDTVIQETDIDVYPGGIAFSFPRLRAILWPRSSWVLPFSCSCIRNILPASFHCPHNHLPVLDEI